MVVLSVSDDRLAGAGVTFTAEDGDLGEERIAAFRLGSTHCFFQARDSDEGSVTLCVDMNGCLKDDINPSFAASRILASLKLDDVEETWRNFDVNSIYAERKAKWLEDLYTALASVINREGNSEKPRLSPSNVLKRKFRQDFVAFIESKRKAESAQEVWEKALAASHFGHPAGEDLAQISAAFACLQSSKSISLSALKRTITGHS